MTGLLRTATAAGSLVLLLWSSSAQAEERRVTITADGVTPRVLQVEPGDTVRFVNEDGSFAYRARSTGGPWRFDSGPTALLQGDFVVPDPLTAAGTYTYRVAQDEPFHGTVVLGEPPSSPEPAATTPAATSAAPAATASALPAPPPAAAAGAAPVASPTPAAAPAVSGTLAGTPTGRELGLPVAVATVLLAGAGSLLLRLLLAEPVLSEGRGTLGATSTSRAASGGRAERRW